MRLLSLTLACLVGAVAFGQDQPATPPATAPPAQVIDSSTPDKAVQAFIAAFMSHDGKALVKLIADATETPELVKALTDMTTMSQVSVGGSDFEVVQQGADAVVIYKLSFGPLGQTPQVTEDMVRLKQTPDGWRIVAAKGGVSPSREGLTALAGMIAKPEALLAQAKKSQIDPCGNNIRQIGLAVIMYSADNDDMLKFAPSQSEVKKAIAPYVTKGEDLWKCAGVDGPAFSFNVKLAGHAFSEMDNPATFILLYEGKMGTVEYRHEGRAWICFGDGHVKLVGPDEIGKYLWAVKK